MADFHAQVVLHTADNVPENFISNTFSFEAPSLSGVSTLTTPLLKAFYDSLNTPLLSPVIAQNGHEIKYFELPGLTPNYPFDIDVFNLAGVPSGTALPDEVSICLSFQGVVVAGLPQARRRGRVFLGPLKTTAATANRPSTTALTAVGVAAVNLRTSFAALGTGYWWTVWSPSNGSSTVITNGWSDNAFDTQRRRGVLATSRAVW